MAALSQQLREQTAAAHQSLEDHLDILRDDLTRANYVDLLQAFNGYLTPWLPRVQAHLSADLNEALDGQRHLDRLQLDLNKLDAAIDAEYCSELPPVVDFASAMGSCYVIEGSMLGARIVGPALQRRFGLDAESGCAYFAGDGDATGRRWNIFRKALDERFAASEYNAVIDSANKTFETMQRWFQLREVAR